MKKTIKKLSALALAALLLLGLNATAFAAELADGEAGTWISADTEIVQDKFVNIQKELIAFNANGTQVNAPAFTYVYTVTPASVTGLTVTDQTADHTSGTAVQAPVKAGLTTGLVVTGTAAGTAGTAASAVGTLVFTNSTTLNTAAAGTANSYNIKLDFANVAFTQPGVYRYQIAETLADSATYDGIAVEDGGTNTLYLDVYVDGELNIYGYVCMAANASVTPSTTKTNGFVAASNGADKYYTYDLTLSKTVENDTYDKNNTAFPFTVIFKNAESYATTFTIAETAGTGSTGISPAAASAPTWSGVAQVKDGGAITYTGIPAGVDVDVYETNIASGVTFTVSTSVNGGTAVVDKNVVSGTTPASAVAQTTKGAAESTKATVDTPKIATVSATQTVGITNTLLLISPTGLVLRYAPYLLMFGAGVVLLVLSRRGKKEDR